MPRNHPTNPVWKNFGEAQGDLKHYLQNLGPIAKKDRKNWLKQYEMRTMSFGPYPLTMVGHGWMKAWITDQVYEACYIPRGDLNLDVTVMKRNPDNGPREPVSDESTEMSIRVVQEEYVLPAATFEIIYDKSVKVPVKDVKSMIRQEAIHWPLYDEAFRKEVRKILANRQKSAELKRKRQRTMKAKESAYEKAQEKAQAAKQKAQEKAQVPKPSRAKRRLTYASKKVSKRSKGPEKIHLVTKLDRALEAQTKQSIEIKNMLWAQRKLTKDEAFLKCLAKPQKLAGRMFEVMTKKDLVAIAKKLAANCAQDSLEEILQSYRFIALEHSNEIFSAKCKEAIATNAEVKKLQVESGVSGWPDEDAADVGPEDVGPEDVGPEDVGPEDVGPEDVGPEDVGPKAVGPEDVGPEDVGPKAVGPKDVGPEDVGPEDVGPMHTPAVEVQPHWIRSSRSSSGFKGVIKDARRGWRAKHGNSTIGRFATVEEAAQAYYDFDEALKNFS